MNKKSKSKNSNADQDAFASDLLDAIFKPALQELEKELEGDESDAEKLALKKNKKSKKAGAGSKSHTEIQLSGRIDSFVFGVLKDPYFEEFANSHLVLKDGGGNKEFLEKMFSLFLENDPFSDKSNLEIFKDSVVLGKFKKVCPNFHAIYETVLTDDYEKNELVTTNDDVYIKNTAVTSSHYDHFSFLKEILESPNFSNPLRVFSTDNFIEIYKNGEKIDEGQLDQFLKLRQVEYEEDDEDFDEDGNFRYTEKQIESQEKFSKNKFGYPGITLKPVARSKRGSIQYDGFWPNDFFKFVLGDSKELYEEPLYLVIDQHFQYDPSKEVRIDFSNVSRCVFKIDEDLDYEKLMFLRCGLEEDLRQYAINYSDDINLFNYIAYDGLLIPVEETIFRDQGIQIHTSREMRMM